LAPAVQIECAHDPPLELLVVELAALLAATLLATVELLVLPEQDSPQIEVTSVTHIESHMVLQQ
jgi:hypothetical protein